VSGDYWRLLTGAMAHLSVAHLLVNIAAYTALAWVFRHAVSPRLHNFLFAANLVAIGPLLLACLPGLHWYAGLSAPVHGYAYALALLGTVAGEGTGMIVLTLLCAKLVVETRYGPLPGSEQLIGGAVAIQAHAAGMLAGLVLASVMIALRGVPRRYNAGAIRKE
jgi:rhomboid family GlyGly-CTERM serine protease